MYFVAIDSIISIYGGIGGRLIQSMAMFNMVSDANGIRMFSAVAPNNSIDYGAAAQSNPSNFSDVTFTVFYKYNVYYLISIKSFH